MLKLRSLTIAALAVFGFSSAAQAATATNVMNNIVTVAQACDIVAIGVDFGIRTVPFSGVTAVVTGNTSTGNTVTMNSAHPKKQLDGGAGNDDVLSLNVGGVAVPVAIADAGLPGVYVACTTTPTGVTLTSAAAGATAASLPVALGPGAPTTFSGKMAKVDSTGAVEAAGTPVDYTLTLAAAVVSTPAVAAVPAIFTGTYLATGAIPDGQATVVPGFYWDSATAAVNF